MEPKQYKNYIAGIYLRLSRDDERAGESLSIENQKILVTKYVKEKGWEIKDVYVDNANQVWCVFDIDYTYKENRLIPALKEAEAQGIKIAYSNIAFEVWLISHFEKCKPTLQLNDYGKELNNLLKTNGFGKIYDKADKNLLKDSFIPKYKTAVENAKIVYQKYVKEYNAGKDNRMQPIWKWSSSTTVYKLVEALKLK